MAVGVDDPAAKCKYAVKAMECNLNICSHIFYTISTYFILPLPTTLYFTNTINSAVHLYTTRVRENLHLNSLLTAFISKKNSFPLSIIAWPSLFG